MKNLIILAVLVMSFTSCVTTKQADFESYVTINGKKIEIVADEYGNGYMKQKTQCGSVYIPFPFPFEEEEIPRVYETKNILKQIN